MSQMRPVAKRYNLYTFSLFPLKVLLFILKHIFKLRKLRQNFRSASKAGYCPAPGTDKTGKCHAVTREWERRALQELNEIQRHGIYGGTQLSRQNHFRYGKINIVRGKINLITAKSILITTKSIWSRDWRDVMLARKVLWEPIQHGGDSTCCEKL